MNWSIGNIIWIIIGGAIIGIIARLLLRGRQNIPFWSVIVAGIIGMFVGDWLSGLLGVKETFGFDWIRHGLQLLVGVGAVAVISALFNRGKSSGGSHSGGVSVAAPASNVAATAPGAVAGTAAAAGAAVAGAAATAGDAVSGAATSAGDAAAAAVQDAGQSAAAAVESVAGDAASGVADAAAQAAGSAGEAVGSATEAVQGAVGQAGEAVADAASDAVGQASDAVTEAAQNLGEQLPGQ